MSEHLSNQISDKAKSILFTIVLCLVCGILLTAASTGLKPLQQKNMLLDRKKNILASINLLESDKTYSSEEINSLYSKNLTYLTIDEFGQVIKDGQENDKTMPLYLYEKTRGVVEAYIIPIDARGLWGKILGYMAIKKDGSTISGFTVYKHSETPGLGGEIEQNWFRKNFVGKKILDQAGSFVSITIAKGKVDKNIPEDRQINYVDGISGATLTGKFLSKSLKDNLLAYEPVSVRFRDNRSKFEDRFKF